MPDDKEQQQSEPVAVAAPVAVPELPDEPSLRDLANATEHDGHEFELPPDVKRHKPNPNPEGEEPFELPTPCTRCAKANQKCMSIGKGKCLYCRQVKDTCSLYRRNLKRNRAQTVHKEALASAIENVIRKGRMLRLKGLEREAWTEALERLEKTYEVVSEVMDL